MTVSQNGCQYLLAHHDESVGEIHGVVAAALAIDENRAIMASVPNAPRLLAHMRARAAGILAYRRTPSVADRFREQMRQRLAVAA